LLNLLSDQIAEVAVVLTAEHSERTWNENNGLVWARRYWHISDNFPEISRTNTRHHLERGYQIKVFQRTLFAGLPKGIFGFGSAAQFEQSQFWRTSWVSGYSAKLSEIASSRHLSFVMADKLAGKLGFHRHTPLCGAALGIGRPIANFLNALTGFERPC